MYRMLRLNEISRVSASFIVQRKSSRYAVLLFQGSRVTSKRTFSEVRFFDEKPEGVSMYSSKCPTDMFSS